MIFSSVGLDVLQSSLQEHIANDQLTVAYAAPKVQLDRR